MNLLRYICLLALLLTCLFATNTSFALSLTPDEALVEMRHGNERFVSGHPTHPHSDQARIAETATGQNPFVTVIACSDSRVPVERVFDQGIGDMFVIRVAGNVCDTDEIGSIEYGVDHLGTPLMIVLGHVNCGAVTAVATGAKLHGSIPALVDNIAPAVERAENITGLKGSALVPKAVEENVWQSISDLLSGSPATAMLVSEHQLKVIGAVYDITDGTVEWLGEHPGQASLLSGSGRSHSDSGSHADSAGHGSQAGASEAGGHGADSSGHGTESAEGHGEEGETKIDDEMELKVLLSKSMTNVYKLLLFMVIGMCILGLGLALVAFQSMKFKAPAISLPKKKKPKPAPVDETAAAEPGEGED